MIQEYQDLIQIINTLPILSENPLDWNEKRNGQWYWHLIYMRNFVSINSPIYA